jgi:hypothetical protein
MTTSPEMLRTAEGLTWLGTEQHVIEAKSTWRTIVPVGASAFGRVTDADGPIEMQRNAMAAWIRAFDNTCLLASSSEVLLSLGGHAAGGAWERVRVSDPLALLRLGFPEPEFVAMNPEKTCFVAITTEEHELLIFCGTRQGDDWKLYTS